MIRTPRLLLTIAAAASAATAIFLAACASKPPGNPAAPLSVVRTAPPAFPAMAYYDVRCAQCHGPEGASYGPSLGRHLDDAGLVKVTADMAHGPSQAPIYGQDLDTETAFHRALIMGNPFLSVTKIDGPTWSGEVMVDAKVTLHIGRGGQKEISADVTDWNWSATLPAGTKLEDVTITAEVDNKTTTLHPAQSMYSNTDHIPPPDQRNHLLH